MRVSLWSSIFMASSCLAQGDIVALLQSQEDLSTLLELAALIDGLPELLSTSSNITIFAPTNEAFAKAPRDLPEGQAIENKNDTGAIGALLANHVFKGTYPASAATDTPLYVRTLLDPSYMDGNQPFTGFKDGQCNGIVKNGNDVCVLSGELTISTVTQADIKLGEGITIHKIDTVLSFGAPFQVFTARSGYTLFNAALEAASLGINFGLTEADSTALNITDFTAFVPDNAAFQRIGSVLASADQATVSEVLKYHLVPDNTVFSTSLGNITVKSLQGDDLVFTVLPDGTAFVNNAKITFPNTILYNGVAHVIDNVIAPGPFDRTTFDFSAPVEERIAFPSATPVSSLPPAFSSVSFSNDSITYSATPVLLLTIAAVPTPTGTAGASGSATTPAPTATAGTPIPTAAAENIALQRVLLAAGILAGVAAAL